jgi:hypothetical protein
MTPPPAAVLKRLRIRAKHRSIPHINRLNAAVLAPMATLLSVAPICPIKN